MFRQIGDCDAMWAAAVNAITWDNNYNKASNDERHWLIAKVYLHCLLKNTMSSSWMTIIQFLLLRTVAVENDNLVARYLSGQQQQQQQRQQ